MTDIQNTPNAEVAIASLKKQADRLGIAYKSNTSVATLQKSIADKLSDGSDEVADAPKAKSISDYHDEAMKLVRVIITPMESTKATNLESEMFCAGNSVVGTVKRTIPFGEEWHVEQILLNSIKEKYYQAFITKKNALGVPITTSKLVRAYSIAVLDPLTPEELDALADRQIRTRALDDE